MKRFAFWFVAAILVIHWVRSGDRHHKHGPAPAAPVRTKMTVRTLASADQSAKGEKVYVLELNDERYVTIDEKGVVHVASRKPVDSDRKDDNDEELLAPADGLPVAIVPGSRVTEARIEAPRPPQPPKAPKGPKLPRSILVRQPPKSPDIAAGERPAPAAVPEEKPLVVAGRLSATEERAVNDARAQLLLKLRGLLESQVPRDWNVPTRFVNGMIRETKVVPVERDYGTMYQATMLIDFSPSTRDQIVSSHRHEQAVKRLATLGGLLAFVLICLSTLSGYIRADEATKGYYTNRLRLAAAAGVGVAGTVIYQMLT